MSNKPWGEDKPWKTKSNFMTYLRGCLRLAWKKHPAKLNLIKNNRYKIDNPNKNGKVSKVWGFKCEICEQEKIIKNCQVDHKIPAGSLQDEDDIEGFIKRLLFVTEDDLRLVCTECHRILTHSQKRAVSFEEASCEVQAIDFQKSFTPAQQKRKLRDLGASEDEVANEKSRRKFYVKYLMNGGK